MQKKKQLVCNLGRHPAGRSQGRQKGDGEMPEVIDKVAKIDSRNDIYSFLRNQILSLVIEPGEMLSENSLSSQMSVSRALVRDALARLTEEGYIVVYPQRGTVVTMIDPERIKQSVHTHIVLEQAVIEEVCRQGLTPEQKALLEESLEKQKEVKGDSDVLELLAADRHMRYLLSTFCGKEHIWDYFRTLDCDMMRVNYLQYITFNFKVYMSSLTRWEHTQVETRLLLDNIMRGDAEAASLICSNHFNAVLWNTDTLQGIYPQFFSR